jgi:hypothetical protein
MTLIERQRGLSLLGFIFLLILALFVAYLGIKLVPIYLNHHSAVSDMRAVAREPGSANTPLNTLRRSLMTRYQISFVDHISAEHITIESGNPPTLVLKYEVQEHLIGNIDVVVKFNSAESLRH